MTSAGFDVTTFGETMAALRAQDPIRLGGSLRLSVAGAESNVAIGLARLGHRVRWAGLVGDDETGALVLRTLRAEGVDVEHARVDARGPTGLILFERRIADLTRVTYHRSGSAGSLLAAADVLPALAAEPRVLHLTGITPALGPAPAAAVRAAVADAAGRGVRICLDVNYRSLLWDRASAAAALRPLAERLTDLRAARLGRPRGRRQARSGRRERGGRRRDRPSPRAAGAGHRPGGCGRRLRRVTGPLLHGPWVWRPENPWRGGLAPH